MTCLIMLNTMNTNYLYLIAILLFPGMFTACTGEKHPLVEKPKYMWFDAEANFERFQYKDSITYYLDKTKQAGFNRIVVDVRPLQGDVLYTSSHLAPLTRLDGYAVERDWDYLQFFIKEAWKRELKVSVSTTIFSGGRPHTRDGMVYHSHDWDEQIAVRYRPEGLVSMKDDCSQVAIFLNPLLPEVREFCLRFIREIVEKYEIDGYALDYCRYSGVETDFSRPSRQAFEAYIGKEVEQFPQDIFTWEQDKDGNFRTVPGPYYKPWFEFRAQVIHDFIERAKQEIKAIRPDVQLEYWAPS
ncbi:MAG: family 10 glycosylhydrolase [Firmicutes bacterium]|nr:family 10 glycosylhydrolase [Bacillota bacterium]